MLLPQLLLALAVWLSACAASEASPAEDVAPSADAGNDAMQEVVDAAPVGAEPGAVIPIGGAPDAGPCTWVPRRCGARGQRFEIAVGSPLGMLQVQSAGVYYWNGFTVGTGVWFEGTVAGQLFTLSAERANELIEGALRAATLPGRYTSGNSWSDVYARLATCERVIELHQVELVIERHDVPDLIRNDSSIQLEGRLVISDPAWSFEVPFRIEQVCEVSART